MMPFNAVRWEVLINWVLIGTVGGFFLYRPDWNLAQALCDDEDEHSWNLLIFLGCVAALSEFTVVYAHYLFSEVEQQ